MCITLQFVNLYVSKFSNHPPQVLKNVPQNINKRLSSISSSVGCFNEEKDVYQKALKEASYDHILHFNPDISTQDSGRNRKRRKRSVLWFNPSSSLNVKTSIGKRFFAILKKHYPPGSPLF